LSRKSIASQSILALAGFFLTLTTMLFGAPFIRVFRQRSGPIVFWITGIAFGLITYDVWNSVALVDAYAAQTSVMLFLGPAVVWLAVGMFTELEAKGMRWIWNGFLSVVLGTIAYVGGAIALFNVTGVTNKQQLADVIKAYFKNFSFFQPPAEFDFMTIVNQLPSIATIVVVLVLAHALIFEKSVYRWFRIPRERLAAQIKLLDFKLPDVFVWIGMVAFLGTIMDWKGQNYSINVLNVCIVLFFLQGIAVLEYFYKTLRVGFFVRAMGYFLFVFQLFVVLAFVGFIDFWVDFRKRIRKLPAKSQNNQNARLL
jgi:hypothetical protein